MKSRNAQSILEALCKKTHQNLLRYLLKQTLLVALGTALMVAELGIFLYFFLFSGKTLLPAFCLACFILTLFFCLVIRLYILSRKTEVFDRLLAAFIHQAQAIFKKKSVVEEQPEIAAAVTQLSLVMQHQEYFVFCNLLKIIPPYDSIKKFSCFCFWKDYFMFRELLLQKAVDLYLLVVQAIPTDLGAHVSLADAYVSLSGLYADPRKYPEFDTKYWVPPGRYGEDIQEKFFVTARRATEEFKILNEYAPGNVWVHSQLAYSYHDLQMPMEEIREYEIVLKLKPNEANTMMKLGILYFQQGMNAKGLQVYEQLRKVDLKKSKKLIKFYGIVAK